MNSLLLNPVEEYDVLVIGSGIAGINAAVNAAEAGSKAAILSKGKLFSGSSFYPGTWGLGLIGPENEEDIPDLEESIKTVGSGMATEEIVGAFISGIPDALRQIRKRGVKLRTANQKDQREFIPCFDRKHRDWNGLEFESVREVFGNLIKELGISVIEGSEALSLVKHDGKISGVVFFDGSGLKYASAKAVVLASGGYGSLFRYHLCTEDVIGSGQALALNAGCRLINMEFMQMMPGYIYPAPKTVFNEKTFRFTDIRRKDGEPVLKDDRASEILDIRSGHGPFTSRLSSKTVDIEIFKEFMQDPDYGVEISYTDELREAPPEFVTTYFDWLYKSKGLTLNDAIHVGIFAHAANGGIMIGSDTSTGVRGLFAAGEVTGGMHGADRIGGLSTANGLVFGQKAGAAASSYAKGVEYDMTPASLPVSSCNNEPELVSRLQDTMFKNAMVIRSQSGLTEALQEISDIGKSIRPGDDNSPGDIAAFYRMQLRLTTAECIVRAALARKESRGSHYRIDYPSQNKEYDKPFVLCKQGGISLFPRE